MPEDVARPAERGEHERQGRLGDAGARGQLGSAMVRAVSAQRVEERLQVKVDMLVVVEQYLKVLVCHLQLLEVARRVMVQLLSKRW